MSASPYREPASIPLRPVRRWSARRALSLGFNAVMVLAIGVLGTVLVHLRQEQRSRITTPDPRSSQPLVGPQASAPDPRSSQPLVAPQASASPAGEPNVPAPVAPRAGAANEARSSLEESVRAFGSLTRERCWTSKGPHRGQGAATVTVEVDDSGHVQQTTATGKDPALNRCLAGEVRGWRFGRGPRRFDLPFVFGAEEPSKTSVPGAGCSCQPGDPLCSCRSAPQPGDETHGFKEIPY